MHDWKFVSGRLWLKCTLNVKHLPQLSVQFPNLACLPFSAFKLTSVVGELAKRESGRHFSSKTKKPLPFGQVKYLFLSRVPSEHADSSFSFKERKYRINVGDIIINKVLQNKI